MLIQNTIWWLDKPEQSMIEKKKYLFHVIYPPGYATGVPDRLLLPP